MGSRRRNRNQHFELQALLALVVRQELAAAAEKRVGRHGERRVQAALFENASGPSHPGFAPGEYILGLADAHHFPLVKHLQPGGIAGRLISEDVAAAEIER